MEKVEWGEFRIEELFNKLNLKFNKSTFDKENDISREKSIEFDLPLVNAKDGSNGIMYYGRSQDFESAEMCIDIVNDGAISTGNVYAQPQKTGVLYNAYLIQPKFNINERLLHFFASVIFKSIKLKFGYENKAGWEKVKKEKITLPLINKKIDYGFMESFITEIETAYISDLNSYLLTTGLHDYNLTAKEQQVLNDFENGKIKFSKISVGELFEINTYKKRFDANKVIISRNGRPYVVRTSLNNGIRGYINEDEQFLNPGNTISFGQDTATMFYQEKPYFTGDKIKILQSKNEKFNRLNGLFFITAMTKSFSSFSWGGSSFNVNIIANQLMQLPSDNNKPQYELMEIFISAIQKLVIRDVCSYLSNKLQT